MTVDMFSDTPVHKLARNDDPQTSKDAAREVSSGKMLTLVYNEVVKAKGWGITTKEIRAIYPDLPYSSITARPAALEEDGKIYYAGDRREKCRVIRATSYNLGEIDTG